MAVSFPSSKYRKPSAGNNRVIEHGTIDMPIWGRAFEGVRSDWGRSRRKAFANQQIYNLAEYLSTIQVAQ